MYFSATDTGVLAAIGNTPTVRLNRLFPSSGARMYGKLELLNPGGSAKDRPAVAMLRGALESGRIKPGDTIIESSSGNMAIGLAQACCILDLKLICVLDRKATRSNVALLRAYGAIVDMVEAPHPVTGDWLDARIARIQDLLADTPRGWWPDQYGNLDNAISHQYGTASEITRDLGGPPAVILAAASTCGIVGGLVRWVDETGAPTKIVAVDVRGSRLFGGRSEPRHIPGIGSSNLPRLVDPARVEVEIVDDADCVAGCRHLLAREGLLGGGSSGAVVTAAQRVARRLPPDASMVLILVDRGERYLDTVYDETWVRQMIGAVPVLEA